MLEDFECTETFPTWDQMSEKDQLLTTISDVYKDVNGFRPRGYFDYSVGELKCVLDELYKDMEREIIENHNAELVAMDQFEKHVESVKSMCNCDRERAIVFIMDSEDVRDKEELCLNLNLPCNYFRGV